MKSKLWMAVLALGATLVAGLASTALAAEMSTADMVSLLEELDERQTNNGDSKTLAYVQQKEKGKADVVFELVFYRRDLDDKFMILFLKPKAEAGKGYLKIGDNLWLYDPATGSWARRTERERIGGTDSRRADFDRPTLAKDYDPTYLGEGKLGKYQVDKLKLQVKSGKDVAWPVIEIWVDKETKNVLKRQEYALSGKLMRTSYFPKWGKIWSEKKGAEVWYPKEMRLYDEIEKGNQTVVVLKKIDLRDLKKGMFTKAWLESKSR